MDWSLELEPLISIHQGKRYPLSYENEYQLVIPVILEAQETKINVNSVLPRLFRTFPSFEHLESASEEQLYSILNSIRNFENKAKAILKLSKRINAGGTFPQTMSALMKLPGISRRCANIILHEMHRPAEGIFIDSVVLRSCQRLGITEEENIDKAERLLMQLFEKKNWGEIGMALLFHGREVCRSESPKCSICILSKECKFFSSRTD